MNSLEQMNNQTPESTKRGQSRLLEFKKKKNSKLLKKLHKCQIDNLVWANFNFLSAKFKTKTEIIRIAI